MPQHDSDDQGDRIMGAAITDEQIQALAATAKPFTLTLLWWGSERHQDGVAVMTVSPEEAEQIMAADPCVQAGMIRAEVHPGAGFPGDTIPG